MITTVPSERLLDLICTLTDAARLGPDLAGLTALAAERAQSITGAIGAVVELAEGADLTPPLSVARRPHRA